MKRVLAGFALFAVLASAAVAAFVALARPLALIPADVGLLIVSDCPASQFALRSLRQSESAVRERLWPIVVPTGDVALNESICNDTVPALQQRVPSLRLLPRALLCRRLLAETQTFATAHVHAFPAYAIDGVVVPTRFTAAGLALVGIAPGTKASGWKFTRATPEPKAREVGQEDWAITYQAVGY